ncbi:acyl-CoA dehydrogenase family protein [Embleya sp. NPDC008237]|uniref:acyl-CoA dehydrogenase family protein n=1 Tax=Embleya sp. NPDC008237 TaxID=3363978 RepID=UPI0036EEDBE6
MDVSHRDEVGEFTANAAALITRHWGRAGAAPTGDLDRLWDVGAVHGWFDLGDTGALAAAIALVRALGRAACPLPVLDAFVAARLFAANTGLAGAIGDGGIRVVTALPGGGEADVGTDCLIEAGDAATHVLRLPYGGGPVGLYRILAAEPVEGLAVPRWSRARLGAALAYDAIPADRADRLLTLLRLGLAARAFGAAERTVASGRAGSGARREVRIGARDPGRPRAEHSRIELDAGDLLITDAVRRYTEGATDWVLAAELAVAHVRRIAPRVRVDAHRSQVSAAGRFDDHETPWLFRRVHTDLACLGAFGTPGGEVADRLLEADPDTEADAGPDAGVGLPEPRLGPDGDALREAVRKVVASRPTPLPAGPEQADDPATVAELAEHGWFALDWSAVHGGSGGTPAERFALRQEVCRHRLPVTAALACATAFGAAIARHGTPEQRERLLPGIRRGTLRIASGYRATRAEFDPAAVRVRAARAGGAERGDWVVTGDRLWSTDADGARYVWLAARTDPDRRRPQAGLTVFLVPLDTPGVTVRPHRSPAGESGCSVLLDRVEVADTARIGAVHGGWSVIVDTFAAESVAAGDVAATLHRELVDLIGLLRTGPEAASAAGPRGSAARAGLTELAVRVQAIRLLAAAAVMPARGIGDDTARLHALAAGALGGELGTDFGALVLDLLGPAAALGAGAVGVVGEGVAGPTPRRSATDALGGTGDLHRGLFARALGLPVRV